MSNVSVRKAIRQLEKTIQTLFNAPEEPCEESKMVLVTLTKTLNTIRFYQRARARDALLSELP